ncbi:MAG: FAD-binding protein [Actinobacteria bacterium]|nr:FAD-binding protein [Actinomycetota bacterium]
MAVMRVAVLLKQVPKPDFSELKLDDAGRLNRSRVPAEMNPWCRRALAAGVKLAEEAGGFCMAFTMGPPVAEAVVREAIAYGADEGVLITDPRLAGSDTLVTARALAAALNIYGPFDAIFTGKASTDSDTGQVAPAVAQLMDIPFLPAVRQMEFDGRSIRAKCETDDGWLEATAGLPTIVACAERLTAPARAADQERLDAVDASLIHLLDADRLGAGSWGQEGSPTVVGRVRVMDTKRRGIVLSGTPAEQAASVVRYLDEEGVLERLRYNSPSNGSGFPVEQEGSFPVEQGDGLPAGEDGSFPVEQEGRFPVEQGDRHLPREASSEMRTGHGVAVLVEPGQDYTNCELAQIAVEIADDLGAAWVAVLSGATRSENMPVGSTLLENVLPLNLLTDVPAHLIEVLRGPTDRHLGRTAPRISHDNPVAMTCGVSRSWFAVVGQALQPASPHPPCPARPDERLPDPTCLSVGHLKRSRLVVAENADTAEKMASAAISWLQSNNVSVLLVPGTTYGREVAARVGAATSSGVAGDVIGIEVSDGSILALKPALGGSLVAEIGFKSPLQIVTVRPGAISAGRVAYARKEMMSADIGAVHADQDVVSVNAEVVGTGDWVQVPSTDSDGAEMANLEDRVAHVGEDVSRRVEWGITEAIRNEPLQAVEPMTRVERGIAEAIRNGSTEPVVEPAVEYIATESPSRVIVHRQVREVDIGAVLSSDVLVCIGAGVDPSLYGIVDPLVELLGAQRVATRKVTDKGYLSRSLQVGITGINVSPELYLAVGVQGKPNHMAGVRGAGMVVSINIDPEATVFRQSDIGMVGDWRELVPALHSALESTVRKYQMEPMRY